MNPVIDNTIYSEGDTSYVFSNGTKIEEGERYIARWGSTKNTARSCYVKKIFYPKNQRTPRPFVLLKYYGSATAVNIKFLEVI